MALNVGIIDPSIVTQGVRESKIDLATPVNIYTSLRADRRAQKLSELTLSKEERERKRADDLQRIVQSNLTENGHINTEKVIPELNRAGFVDEAASIQDRYLQAAQNREKAKQEAMSVAGNAASAVLSSKDPTSTFLQFQKYARENNLPISEDVKNHSLTDEEGHMGKLHPKIESYLQYLDELRLTPEQKLAKQRLAAEGGSPEEMEIKKARLKLDQDKLGLDTKRFQLDEKKLKSELDDQTKGLMPKEKAVQVEEGLRKEYINQNKEFQSVGDAYNRIKASASNPSAAGDLSLIFNFMKMLDPGSTVREGEFATAQNAGGIDDRTRAYWNKLKRGERLDENQRADFISRANALMEAAISGYDRSVSTYKTLANNYGVNPNNVVIDLGRSAPDLGPWEKSN